MAGLVLVALIRAPERRRGLDGVRGHRVFGTGAASMQRIDVALDQRRFSARRVEGGWELDGRLAAPTAAAALTDLADYLSALRAVDAFRSGAQAAFGLTPPRGALDVVTPHRQRRLLLGGFTAGSTTLYARREGDPRVLTIGTLLLSAIERVFYFTTSTSSMSNTSTAPGLIRGGLPMSP